MKRKTKPDIDSVIEEHEAYEARLSRTQPEHAKAAREEIGTVTKFFDKIGVAAIMLKGELSVGDIIEIGTEEDAIRQRVTSMQIDREDVNSAVSGAEVGIKIKYKVEAGSTVYKI